MPENTIIAIVNEKGGTGKTTTSVSLAASLGALGKKVLLVDLDGQAASSRWLGMEEDDRLADALRSGNGLVPVPDVLPNVSLAPASGKLDSVSHDLRPTQGGQLRKVLGEVQGFDFILIDCPPSLGNRLIGNALLAATHVLVPVETSILALDGLKILLTTLEDVRDGFGHEIVLAGVLACRYDGRTKLSQLVLTELRRALPGKVFNTVIRENVRMRECPASGQSILDFASDSNAAKDYRALAQEMLDEPDKWRLPLDPASREAEQGFAVDDLRDQAAARVREASNRKTTRKSESDESPLPQEAEASAEAPTPWEQTPTEPAEEPTVAPPQVNDAAAAVTEEPDNAPATPGDAHQPAIPAWWLVDGESSSAPTPPQATQPEPPQDAAPAAEQTQNTPDELPSAGETISETSQSLGTWLDGIEQASKRISEQDDIHVLGREPEELIHHPEQNAETPTDDETVPAEMKLPSSEVQIPVQVASNESNQEKVFVVGEESPEAEVPAQPADDTQEPPQPTAEDTAEPPADQPVWEDESSNDEVQASEEQSEEPSTDQPVEQQPAASPLAQSLDALNCPALPPKHTGEGEASPASATEQQDPHELKGGLDGSVSADEAERFPALREMLRKMAADDETKTDEAEDKQRRPAWRKLFDRSPSNK